MGRNEPNGSVMFCVAFRLLCRCPQLVNEMLQGIRAIKFYNWETPFKEKVEEVHNAELEILRRSTVMRSLLVSVVTCTPAFVTVITLGLYRCGGERLPVQMGSLTTGRRKVEHAIVERWCSRDIDVPAMVDP